jgi:hypothetical protein
MDDISLHEAFARNYSDMIASPFVLWHIGRLFNRI